MIDFREGERERSMDVREKHGLVARPDRSLGVCPDQELNLKPFSVQVDSSTS